MFYIAITNGKVSGTVMGMSVDGRRRTIAMKGLVLLPPSVASNSTVSVRGEKELY